jgi:flagellin
MIVGTDGTVAPVALADGSNATGLIGTDTKSLATFDTAAFTEALENVATLRARNGGQVSRLQFSQENTQSQVTNLQSAVGRIVDVDIATETANLAKQQILVQASASMVAQANTANNVALMLLS